MCVRFELIAYLLVVNDAILLSLSFPHMANLKLDLIWIKIGYVLSSI